MKSMQGYQEGKLRLAHHQDILVASTDFGNINEENPWY